VFINSNALILQLYIHTTTLTAIIHIHTQARQWQFPEIYQENLHRLLKWPNVTAEY